jgi:hemerythrin-like domain-containing protein
VNVLLAGQAAAPPGPCDLTGMYVMHHGFRRDLRRFASAVRHTPADDVTTWRALRARWARFGHLLHEHHRKEDEAIWPLLVARCTAAGDAVALAVLADMEVEHGEIDPLLDSIDAGLSALAAGGPGADAATVADLLDRARVVLGDHLAHEERDAIPIIQAHVDESVWAHLERTRLAERPTQPGELMFLLAWVADGLDDDVLGPFLAAGGPVVRLLLRLGRPRYLRRDAVAFAHVKEEER